MLQIRGVEPSKRQAAEVGDLASKPAASARYPLLLWKNTHQEGPRTKNMMRTRILIAITTLLLTNSLTLVDCFAQRRQPSTPEERAKVLQMARDFEADPLSEDSKKAREWFITWIKEVPDIVVTPCARLLDPIDESQRNYAAGLIIQMELSSAVFAIENPAQAQDRQAKFKAGVDGMLKIYQAILRTHPQARWPVLDSYIQMQKMQNEGYVREVMAKCSPVPLSDRNQKVYAAGDTVYAPIEVSQTAKIKKQPLPIYAQEARARAFQGTVVLEAVLASSGKVTDITVIEDLPYGLTEKAIEAARKIKFEPAIKGNRQVSTLVRFEYNFHLY